MASKFLYFYTDLERFFCLQQENLRYKISTESYFKWELLDQRSIAMHVTAIWSDGVVSSVAIRVSFLG